VTNQRPRLLARATRRRELFGTGQVGLIPKRPWRNLVTDLDGIFGTSLTTTILTDLGFDGVLGSRTSIPEVCWIRSRPSSCSTRITWG
jgi:hypothetical protein